MAFIGGDDADDVTTEDFISVIEEENISRIISSQDAMISKLEKTNAMLHTVCELSSDRLGLISTHLRASTKTLITLKNELSVVMKRVDFLKSTFQKKFPREYAVAAHQVLAKWESELDADRVVCYQSSSLALFAFSELILFDVLALIVALVSFWVRQQSANVNTYCFGYDRFEVIAVFASTILAILSSFYLLKEAIECVFEPAAVEPEYMPFAAVFTLLLHTLGIYAVENPAFSHVTQASVSSWLQEHTSDISRSVCSTVPGLSRILLPRLNPISLVGWLISVVVLCAYFFMSSGQTDSFPDTIAAVTISLLLFSTMVPMAAYCGRILMQTTPAHLVGTLDKALREASTLEGVLELRNEHFWTVGFGTLIGSLYVRVRRDADEQLVLAHVANRLHPLVKHLTIQVFFPQTFPFCVIKDDWTRPTASVRFDWPQLPVSPPQHQEQMPSAMMKHNHSHDHAACPSHMLPQ
ncbi:unnamed protein product [Schistocephalus solidus]|uniref:KxDL domain-containing protein n=1 Tax=Schistocephalus solidus TaxID=70667 RepID=A0A183SNP7_SCHSO|nr:unnamed protein product [Schistocephalus solidus]